MTFPIWFSAALITASVATAAAKTQNTAQWLGPAEEWVVTQTRAGEIADLSKQFPDKENKRRLSAHFLEELLTGALPGMKLHRHGVRIIGAIIDEPVDLENAQIPCEVWLEHCQFNASANFNGANFAGTLSFENSTFKADAGFNSMKVGRAVFNDAVFEGAVDFVCGRHRRQFRSEWGKISEQGKDRRLRQHESPRLCLH